MSLVEHAKRELELCGQTAEDPAYAASIVAAVAAFASYGHSGGSAMVGIEQLHDLLRYRTLSPITADPAEWIDQSEVSGGPLWQNRRDSAAFSLDGGQNWHFVDGRDKPPTDLAAVEGQRNLLYAAIERVLHRNDTINTLCEADEYELRRALDPTRGPATKETTDHA